MRKILSILLAGIMSASVLVSCTSSKPNKEDTQANQTTSTTQKEDNQKIKVVTTIFPQYDFVREIAGDKVDLDILLSAGEESHSYEPTPKDIIKIQDSDLFIYVGGENDYWVDEVLKKIDKKKTKAIKLIDMVDVLNADDTFNHNHDDDDDDDDDHHHHKTNNKDLHKIDEHVWTSPDNAEEIVEDITDELKQLDRKNANEYEKNSEIYKDKLEKLDDKFENIVETAKRKTIVVGDRFPFRYLAKDYHIDYHSAFDMCQSESDASAKTISSLIDTVKKDKLPVVLKMEMSKGDIASTIAKPNNAKVLQMHSCHNLSKEEWKNNETYLSLMEKNAEVLKEALN